jgi:hypothetical protein
MAELDSGYPLRACSAAMSPLSVLYQARGRNRACGEPHSIQVSTRPAGPRALFPLGNQLPDAKAGVAAARHVLLRHLPVCHLPASGPRNLSVKRWRDAKAKGMLARQKDWHDDGDWYES